jgi:hypothetical protein
MRAGLHSLEPVWTALLECSRRLTSQLYGFFCNRGASRKTILIFERLNRISDFAGVKEMTPRAAQAPHIERAWRTRRSREVIGPVDGPMTDTVPHLKLSMSAAES